MEFIKLAPEIIEYLTVVIITSMVIYSTAEYFIFIIRRRNSMDANNRAYKHCLGQGLLLDWEESVAIDLLVACRFRPVNNMQEVVFEIGGY